MKRQMKGSKIRRILHDINKIACKNFEKGFEEEMTYKRDMTTLTALTEQWAIDRGLDKGDPHMQMLKVVEEVGELTQGLVKKRQDEIVDGIGDVLVTIVILAQQLGLDATECFGSAYDEIKDRKGKLIDGTFVKETDLHG